MKHISMMESGDVNNTYGAIKHFETSLSEEIRIME
jgi:hypothetical protein